MNVRDSPDTWRLAEVLLEPRWLDTVHTYEPALTETDTIIGHWSGARKWWATGSRTLRRTRAPVPTGRRVHRERGPRTDADREPLVYHPHPSSDGSAAAWRTVRAPRRRQPHRYRDAAARRSKGFQIRTRPASRPQRPRGGGGGQARLRPTHTCTLWVWSVCTRRSCTGSGSSPSRPARGRRTTT